MSHREWGDYANPYAFLLETANASHGRLKGKTSVPLIVDGKDKNYAKASKLGRLFVAFDENGIPLRNRAARHLEAVKALLKNFNELSQQHAIKIFKIPAGAEIKERGIGAFLNPPK